MERGVTNTVELSSGSVEEAKSEGGPCLQTWPLSFNTFDVQVDPGAQVLKALVDVPTPVGTSVSGV